MRAQWEQCLARFGQLVRLIRKMDGDSLEIRAFVQPVRKEREVLPAAASPLGAVSRQRWLYLGSAEYEIAPGDTVELDATRLVAQETQMVYWAEKPLYFRAILRREKEAAR